MSDRLLDRFLDDKLLDLQGNDEWYEHVTATAGALSAELRANPRQIVPFAYAALLPDVGDDDPTVRQTLGLLKAEWKTYASVTMASPTALLRAIIFDALLSVTEHDKRSLSVLALLCASALPHVSVGREATLWHQALRELLQAVELEAEAAWSVPSRVFVPPFPEFKAPSVTASLKGKQVNKTELERAMRAAAGPADEDGESTEGNEYWPHQGDPWSHDFAPLAAKAVNDAIVQATGTRTVSLNTARFSAALVSVLTEYLQSFLDQVASTAHGLELRSRLLWWKEALASPSAHVSYRDVDPRTAPGLMAYDYQVALPSLAPVSVTAFLREAICTLLPDEESATLLEWIRALAADPHTEALREAVRAIHLPEGFVPAVSLAAMAEPTADAIKRRTVFAPTAMLTPSQFGVLVFLELQVVKAAGEIVAVTGDDSQSGEDAALQGSEA